MMRIAPQLEARAPDADETSIARVSAASDYSSLAELAYAELLDAIVEQRLPPGMRLVPEVLAAELGVSTTPVKLALARLCAEGLAAELPRRGVTVTRVGVEELAALFRARLLLETGAVREGRRPFSPSVIARLEALLDEQRRLIGTGSLHLGLAFANSDRAFHRGIVSLSENDFVVRWYELTNIHIQANRMAPPASRLGATIQEHGAIITALHAGDPGEADVAIRTHIERALRFALMALDEQKQGSSLRRIGHRRIRQTVSS